MNSSGESAAGEILPAGYEYVRILLERNAGSERQTNGPFKLRAQERGSPTRNCM